MKIEEIRFISLLLSQFFLFEFGVCNVTSNTGDNLSIGELSNSIHVKQSALENAAPDYIHGSEHLLQLATFYKKRLVFDTALLCIRQAIAAEKGTSNYGLFSDCLDAYSHILDDLGESDSALNYKLQSLRIREEISDKKRIASSYSSLSRFYYNRLKLIESLAYAKKSEEINLSIGDSSQLSESYLLKGLVYYYLPKIDSAEIYQLLGLSLAEKSNNKSVLLGLYNALGLLYRIQFKYELAHDFFRKGIELDKSEGDLGIMAKLFTNSGLCFYDESNYDSAIYYLEKGRILAEKGNLLLIEARSTQYLANSYYNIGNYHKSWSLLQIALKLNDSINNENYSKAIADMQVRYETDKKEEQIKLQKERITSSQLQRNVLLVSALSLLFVFLGSTVIFLQRQSISSKKQKIAQQKIDELLKDSELKTYNAMMEGQEEERKRIASDLHDRLGSMLATVKIHFNALDDKVETIKSQNLLQYEKANKLLDEACDEVRKIAHNLSTGMLMHFGLQAALRELMESIEGSGKIKTRLLFYGLPERLHQPLEIGIYRIIQECISNILKHAAAKNITVQLNKLERQLNIVIEDDGIGFDVKASKAKTGMGLKNIDARARKLHGTFAIDSTPGKGTTAIIEIPMPDENG